MIEGLKDGKLVLSNTPTLHEEIEQLRSGVLNATENLLALENKLDTLTDEGKIIDAVLYGKAIYENVKLWKGKNVGDLVLDQKMLDKLDVFKIGILIGWDDIIKRLENTIEGKLKNLLAKELFLNGELEDVIEYYLGEIQELIKTSNDDRKLYRYKGTLLNFVGHYTSRAYFEEKDFEKVKLGLEKYEYIMEQFHQLNIVEEDDELELKISKPNKA